MTDQDIEKLTSDYYASLSNKAEQRPKHVILFSGIPGSGKSHIARAIESKLHAIRISNDDIRDWIITAKPNLDPAERERIKFQVASKLLAYLVQTPNGLIVFDVSCDRPGGYEFYHDWAEERGYQTTLVRLDVPRKIVEQRIRDRGDEGYRTVKRSLKLLDTWQEQWEAFGKLRKADVVIGPDTSIESAIEKIGQSVRLPSDGTLTNATDTDGEAK